MKVIDLLLPVAHEVSPGVYSPKPDVRSTVSFSLTSRWGLLLITRVSHSGSVSRRSLGRRTFLRVLLGYTARPHHTSRS